MSEQPQGREPWHLDKRVNISLIIGLLAQAVVFGSLYGRLENRVANVETQMGKLDSMPEKLARIDEKLSSLIDRLDRQDRR